MQYSTTTHPSPSVYTRKPCMNSIQSYTQFTERNDQSEKCMDLEWTIEVRFLSFLSSTSCRNKLCGASSFLFYVQQMNTGVSGRSVKLIILLHLLQTLRMCGGLRPCLHTFPCLDLRQNDNFYLSIMLVERKWLQDFKQRTSCR